MIRVRRRTLLAALGGGVGVLSGCNRQNEPEDGSETSADSQTDTGEQTTSETADKNTMESGIPRSVTIDETPDAQLREAFQIATQIRVSEPRVTSEQTARIGVALKNTSQTSQTVTYTRERCDLNIIEGQSQERENVSLLLVSTEQEWNRVEEDCWVPDGRNLNCGIPARDYQITINPGERLDWTFHLWAVPNQYTEGICMPLGTYRFVRSFRQNGKKAPLSLILSVEK